MADLTQPVTAEFFTGAGASPEQAQALVAQHEAMSGRRGPEARAAIAPTFENMPPTAPPAPSPSMSNAQAAEALAAHEQAQLQGHLEQAFAPPLNAFDYRAPAQIGDPTEEQYAADSALKGALFAERTPAYLANALMADFAANRISEHNLEPADRAAVIAKLGGLLDRARADRSLAPYVTGATAEGFLSSLSRETVISLVPWAKHVGRR
jgi:hypothetical protein